MIKVRMIPTMAGMSQGLAEATSEGGVVKAGFFNPHPQNQ
jgi:hypothetical protein